METTEATEQERETFNKAEFDSFVKEALAQIRKINETYKKFFEGAEGRESAISEIERYLTEIKQRYEDLFKNNPSGISKSAELDAKIKEIGEYHKKLLDGSSSIQGDIDESHQKITDFYVYLFGGSDGSEGEEKKVKQSIEEIVKFHSDLTKSDGYKEAVEKAHDEIVGSYENLYEKDETGNTKVSQLNNDIERIAKFRSTVDTDIAPFLAETKDDIAVKRKDISALLAGATGGSLVEGFLKSKMEYKQEAEYRKLEGTNWEKFSTVCINVDAFLSSLFPKLFDYTLFICPLVVSVFIFVRPDLVSEIVGGGTTHESAAKFFSGLNFYGRLIISLPLWWISWFGQRSISQKRRLAEEYNHKAQVTKMYLNFSSRETQGSYPISADARKKLDLELIAVIARYPGHVYGEDETMFDKILKIFKASKEAKDELVSKAIGS